MSDLTRLFVGNIGYNVTETMLSEELSKLGVVAENVKIARDKETRGAKGFGFIEVQTTDVERVMKIANGAAVGGRNLLVERAARQPEDDRQRASRPVSRPLSDDRSRDGDAWRDERGSNSKRRQHR